MSRDMNRGRPLSTRNFRAPPRLIVRARSIHTHRPYIPDENSQHFRMRSRSKSNSCEPPRMELKREEENASKAGRRDKEVPKPRAKRMKDIDWPAISDNFKRLQADEFNSVPQAELNFWSDLVKRCYEEIKRSLEVETVRNEAQNEFAEHMKNLVPKKPKIGRSRLLESLKKSEKVETIVESSPKLPPSKLWIHTEKNFASSDCRRLSHIPHIEPYKTSEQEFVKKLWDNFIEGIHGADQGCGMNISDYETYLLFKRFRSPDIDYSNARSRKLLNFSFFTLFPNKYTYKQLQDNNLYEQLCERFDPNHTASYPQSFEEKCAAFKSHICMKCGTINCSYHSVNFFDESEPKQKKAEKIKPLGVDTCFFDEAPCSANCGKLKRNKNVDAENCASFKNTSLEAIFKARIATNVNMCQLTRVMNALCSASGDQEKTCYQYLLHARAERRTAVPQKQTPSVKRFREFKLLGKDEISNSQPHKPCDHEGLCDQMKTDCPCFMLNLACTLECKCGPRCKALFPGCRCGPGLCRSAVCPCFLAGWECNPELCQSCNSDISCLEGDPKEFVCSNIALQHGWKKAVRVGLSTVKNAGYGLFVEQNVDKDELISEYTGETISDAECDRRGAVYDEMNLSYIFCLVPNHSTVDAFRMGNLMRYANHKFTHENPNCRARIMKVNGEQRIGIYANRALKPGEELFFDYGYAENHHDHLISSKKGAPRKKKT